MKPIIIAECCQNHNGNIEILKKQIHAAVHNGADYVKLQAIRSNELTHRERFDKGEVDSTGIVRSIKRPYKQEYDRLKKLDLTLEQEFWFAEECKRAGIASMATVFTMNSAKELRDMGFEAIKIASYDCASYPLLEEVKKYWSTLFVSTGATFDYEIEQAAKILKGSNYHFLHCTTIYPTPLEDLNLRRMDFLRRYTHNVGYSDHTKVEETKLIASKIALALGASCIERHFTILERDQTKDGPVSINPSELKELSDFARLSRAEMIQKINGEYPQWEQTLGKLTRPLSAEELLNRDYYKGRFASIVNDKHVYNWE